MPSCNLEKLRKAAQHGINSSAVVKEARLLDSAEVLVGLGNLAFGTGKLLQSVPFSTLPHLNNILRHGTAFSIRLDSAATQKNSFVGTLSRSLSTPSVSGPAYQICGYHIHSLRADPIHSLSTGDKLQNRMAAFGFKATLGDSIVDNWASKRCYHTVAKNYASTSVCSKGVNSYRSARMSLKNDEKPNHSGIYGYFVYSAIRSRYKIDLDSWSGWKDFHHSASTTRSSGAASDVFNDSSLSVDLVANSTSSSKQKLASDRTLKLLSASCYLPHPEKEETGGEDAHFICSDEHAIGVADGVGGWAEVGINAGLYARELMSNSVDAIREEPKGLIDPARVLEKAHSITRARGSSTACIIALTTQGLHAINLGDSGFIVVRDGRTVFQSPVQQHDFNLTYQLECGPHGDLPSSGQVFTVPVAAGDVVVAGTDGLFDNLYNNEVTAVVVHALRAGFGPQVTAQKIAALARQRAQDRHRQTPFSTAAQDAGIRYYGGKLDDITVVVSYITSSVNEQNASC